MESIESMMDGLLKKHNGCLQQDIFKRLKKEGLLSSGYHNMFKAVICYWACIKGNCDNIANYCKRWYLNNKARVLLETQKKKRKIQS